MAVPEICHFVPEIFHVCPLNNLWVSCRYLMGVVEIFDRYPGDF